MAAPAYGVAGATGLRVLVKLASPVRFEFWL